MKALFFIFLFLSTTPAFAQGKCGSMGIIEVSDMGDSSEKNTRWRGLCQDERTIVWSPTKDGLYAS